MKKIKVKKVESKFQIDETEGFITIKTCGENLDLIGLKVIPSRVIENLLSAKQ